MYLCLFAKIVFTPKVLQISSCALGIKSIKAEIGNLSLASLCKIFIKTFQHIWIQVVWRNFFTCLWLCIQANLCLYTVTGFFANHVTSKITCFYWLCYTVLFSDRWCRYELIGCWNKWHPLHSKTCLCRFENLVAGDTVSRLNISWDRQNNNREKKVQQCCCLTPKFHQMHVWYVPAPERQGSWYVSILVSVCASTDCGCVVCLLCRSSGDPEPFATDMQDFFFCCMTKLNAAI